MATEAVPAVAKFGFQTLGLQTARNRRRGRQPRQPTRGREDRREYEGRARNRLRIHGVQNDAAIFSLIPGDEMANFHRPLDIAAAGPVA